MGGSVDTSGQGLAFTGMNWDLWPLLEEKFEMVKQYAWENPITTLFLVVTTVMCSVPVFCFCTFMFGSTVLLITGSIVVEGALFAVASIVLGTVLMVLGVVSVGFTCFLVISYFTFQFAQSMLTKTLQTAPELSTGSKDPCDSTTKKVSG